MSHTSIMLALSPKNIMELNMGGIYEIYCKANNKSYIGSAQFNSKSSIKSTGFYRRWQSHISTLQNNKHRNPHLQNAWNKYGETAFEFKIVEICENAIILEREQYWIDKYDCVNNGFNILPFSTTTAGRVVRQETKDRLIHALTGKNRPLSLKIALGTEVLQFDNCGNFIAEYYSLQDAETNTGCCRQDIRKCCINLLLTSKGFQWKYKKDFSEIPNKIAPVLSGINKCNK